VFAPEPVPAKPSLAAKSVAGSARVNRTSVFGITGNRGGPPPDIKAKPQALVVEDYDAENHRELSMKKEDKIYVLFWSPLTLWWKGWLNGVTGFFPKDNVKPLFDVDQVGDADARKNTVRGTDSQDKKRRQLILSIVGTEEQYVKDVQMIPDLILRELQGLLSQTETAEVFRNIETICQESKGNLALLNRKAKTEEPVGDVFLRMAKLFETEVIPWAEAQCSIMCLVERLNFNNPEFQQVAEAITEKLDGLNIYEWFAKPVRRALECFSIAKMLLLRTPQDNADFKDLTEAIEVLTRVKEVLKTTLEEIENRLKIVAIQGALQGQESLVTPSRKLIREYSVQEVLRGGKKASERKIVLLTDMLVVVKVKRSGYGQGTLFPLNRISVAAVSDSSAVLKHNIEITLSVGPRKEKRRFAMITASDRDACVNAITTQANMPSQPSLTRESTVGALGEKKGIFQKLRSTRTLSVGGEEGNPLGDLGGSGSSGGGSGAHAAVSLSGGSGASVANALKEGAAGNGSSATGGSPATTALPRPSMTRQSSSTMTMSVNKSPRDKIGMARESSPRAAATDDRKSPRSWASASASSVGDNEAATASLSTSAPSSISGETTTTLARGSSVNCTACGEPVVGSALNSKGKFFHSGCYKCQECSKSLIGIPFAEKKGEVYCRDCALTLFAEPCSGCGKMITGQFLSAFGEKYHPACFLCSAGCGTNVSRGCKQNTRGFFFFFFLNVVFFHKMQSVMEKHIAETALNREKN
jgi:hypothetical protein